MFDLLGMLENLSARARMEDAPAVDVSSKVVQRLSRKVPSPIWPMALLASSASIAAIVIVGLSLPLIEMVADPWCAFFLTASHVLP